jgi:tight adherence protein B
MSQVAKFGALVSAGVNLHSALELTGFRIDGEKPLERMLIFAIQAGAPIRAVTARLVAFELDLERFKLELETANAVPIATRKLLLWLPALSIAIGQLAGFDTVAAIFQPIGLIAFAIALGLIALGVKWSGALLAPLMVESQHPGFDLMKFSLTLTSGGPLTTSSNPHINELVSLSRQTGAPLGELVQNEIELVTHRALQQSMARAKRMSIELLVPMSLTVLPAFLILTIVPMLIGFGL